VKHAAACLDKVSGIAELEDLIIVFAHQIALNVDLQLTAFVFEIAKTQFPWRRMATRRPVRVISCWLSIQFSRSRSTWPILWLRFEITG